MQNLRHSLAPGILDKFTQPVLVLEYFSQILPWSPGPCDLSETIFKRRCCCFPSWSSFLRYRALQGWAAGCHGDSSLVGSGVIALNSWFFLGGWNSKLSWLKGQLWGNTELPYSRGGQRRELQVPKGVSPRPVVSTAACVAPWQRETKYPCLFF